MVVTSSNGGKTWTQPVDLLEQAGAKWEHVPFLGFGGGIGSHQGSVYVALNEGVYVSRDKGSARKASWTHRTSTTTPSLGDWRLRRHTVTATAPAQRAEALARGETNWQFDGTLIRYRQTFGRSDGFGVTGSVIDRERNVKVFHVWGGDCHGMAGIFQYSVSLDTPAVRAYLHQFYDEAEPER
jgi:hypothetical protein